MEVRGELLLRGKGDDLGFVGVGSKDVAILSKLSDRLKKKKKKVKGRMNMLTAKDDGHNEERPRQVAPKGHTHQWSSILYHGSLRWSEAIVVNYTEG